jgi:O-antigen biosynthesis protein
MRSLALARQLLRHHSKHLPKRALRIWYEKGWKGLLASSIDALQHQRPIEEFYTEWIRRYDTLTPRARRKLHADMANWTSRPLLSVIMSVRNPNLGPLRAAVRSVLKQLYPHWELCISDEASTVASVREELLSMAQADRRIRLKLRAEGGSIHPDGVLSLASGQFVAFFEATDLLHEHAPYWVAKELIDHPDTDLIFSDEDKIDDTGNRSSPAFKPDWNAALMLCCNAFGHLGVIRKSLIDDVGGFRAAFDGSRDYDLVLRCARQIPARRIRHISRILYHRRAPDPAVVPDAMPDAIEAGRAVEDYLVASGTRATVNRERGSLRVEYALPSPAPRVSILLPSTGEARLLEPCLRSITTLTTYKNFELALLINEKDRKKLDEAKPLYGYLQASCIRVLAYSDRPFNYPWVNNWGASQVSGDLFPTGCSDWRRGLRCRAWQPPGRCCITPTTSFSMPA